MATEEIQNITDTRFPPAAHLVGADANWVVSVLPNEEAGQQALESALQAGFAPEATLLLHAQEALERAQLQQESLSPAARFFASLARIATDPGNAEAEYVAEAQDGRSLMCIKANAPDEVALAQRVLLASNARRIKYFSQWTLTTLS